MINLFFSTLNRQTSPIKAQARAALTCLVYLIGCYSLVSSNTERMAYGLMYLISALQIGRVILDEKIGSLKLVLFTCTLFIFSLPGVTISFIYGVDHSQTFFAYILFSDLLLLGNRKEVNKIQHRVYAVSKRSYSRNSGILLAILAWCSVSSLILPQGKLLNLLAFLVPYSISLVVFEATLLTGATRRQAALWLIGYLLTLGVYSFVVWDGFGRLVVASLLMAPFLVAFTQLNVWPRLWWLMLAAPFTLIASQLVRYEDIEDIETALVGSAGHHYVVTNDILGFNLYRAPEGLSAFFEQYLLLFTNWIPRDWWAEKPVGIGLSSVDAIYGRKGFDEGYSHSIGFLGELYFTLGSWFLLGFALLVITVILLEKIVSKFDRDSSVPLVVLQINMISYFWGGMATMGSRLWFMLIPVMFMVWLVRGSGPSQIRNSVLQDRGAFQTTAFRREHL